MSTDETQRESLRRPDRGGRRRRREPSEEELRAAYEAELSRITTTDVIAQAVVSLLNLGARRLGARRRRRAARQAQRGATSSRCATRSTRCGRCSRSSSAASRRSWRRCAMRSRGCRWPTRARSQARRRPPAVPAGGRRGPAGRRAAPRAVRARSRWPGRRGRAVRPGAGGVERQAVGARALSVARRRRRAGAGGRHLRGRHDRLRPRLHRVDARAERTGRQMCARQILARHANQTAEDFC